MAKIKNKKDFINQVTEYGKDEKKQFSNEVQFSGEYELLKLKKIKLNDLKFRNCGFDMFEFFDSVFTNCYFFEINISATSFSNCRFINCDFIWSKLIDIDLFSCTFESCRISDLKLADATMHDTKFINCGEILDLSIGGYRDRIIIFENCLLHYMNLEPIKGDAKEQLIFKDSIITESSFDRIDFSNGNFENCNLSLNQFSSCIFSKQTFRGNTHATGNEYNLIDIRTILNSPPIERDILEKVFGINHSEIKEYLIDLTSKIEYQSIFISYSIKDSKIAKKINEILNRRGVFTFLWESDATAGKTLKTIMKSGIKEKDRVLFIASKNSLKSPACQFELSEGRKKEAELWETVLFPIHIDNYLFEIEKDMIRPLESQIEYWENIEQLRRINSLSFENFNADEDFNSPEFEKQILRLIKGLRK